MGFWELVGYRNVSPPQSTSGNSTAQIFRQTGGYIPPLAPQSIQGEPLKKPEGAITNNPLNLNRLTGMPQSKRGEVIKTGNLANPIIKKGTIIYTRQGQGGYAFGGSTIDYEMGLTGLEQLRKQSIRGGRSNELPYKEGELTEYEKAYRNQAILSGELAPMATQMSWKETTNVVGVNKGGYIYRLESPELTKSVTVTSQKPMGEKQLNAIYRTNLALQKSIKRNELAQEWNRKGFLEKTGYTFYASITTPEGIGYYNPLSSKFQQPFELYTETYGKPITLERVWDAPITIFGTTLIGFGVLKGISKLPAIAKVAIKYDTAIKMGGITLGAITLGQTAEQAKLAYKVKGWEGVGEVGTKTAFSFAGAATGWRMFEPPKVKGIKINQMIASETVGFVQYDRKGSLYIVERTIPILEEIRVAQRPPATTAVSGTTLTITGDVLNFETGVMRGKKQYSLSKFSGNIAPSINEPMIKTTFGTPKNNFFTQMTNKAFLPATIKRTATAPNLGRINLRNEVTGTLGFGSARPTAPIETELPKLMEGTIAYRRYTKYDKPIISYQTASEDFNIRAYTETGIGRGGYLDIANINIGGKRPKRSTKPFSFEEWKQKAPKIKKTSLRKGRTITELKEIQETSTKNIQIPQFTSATIQEMEIGFKPIIAPVSTAIPKILPYERQATYTPRISAPILEFKTETKPRTGKGTYTSFFPKTNIRTTSIQVPKITTKTGTIQLSLPRVVSFEKTELETRLIEPPPTDIIPRIPKVPMVPPTFPAIGIFGLPRSAGSAPKTGFKSIFGRGFEYAPSQIGRIFGKKATNIFKQKRVFTGLEIRGV